MRAEDMDWVADNQGSWSALRATDEHGNEYIMPAHRETVTVRMRRSRAEYVDWSLDAVLAWVETHDDLEPGTEVELPRGTSLDRG